MSVSRWMSRPPAQDGFTLAEVIIVAVILSVLAAIIVPGMSDSAAEAEDASLRATLSIMRTAIERYHAEHGVFPGYRSAVPTAPCAGIAGTGAGAPTNGAIRDAFWSQLLLHTDRSGGACGVRSADHPFGPYLKGNRKVPNPITGNATVIPRTSGELILSGRPGAPAGWKYDAISGAFIANDKDRDHY